MMLQSVRDLFPMLLYRGIPRRKLRKIFMSLLIDKPKKSITFIKNIRQRNVPNKFTTKTTKHRNTLKSVSNTSVLRKPTFPSTPYKDYFLQHRVHSQNDNVALKKKLITKKSTNTEIRKQNRIHSSIEISEAIGNGSKTHENKKSKNRLNTNTEEDQFIIDIKENIEQKHNSNPSSIILNTQKPSLYNVSDGFNTIPKMKNENCPHLNRSSNNNNITTENKVNSSKPSLDRDNTKYKFVNLKKDESDISEKIIDYNNLLQCSVINTDLSNKNGMLRYEPIRHYKSENASRNEYFERTTQPDIVDSQITTTKYTEKVKTNDKKDQNINISQDVGKINKLSTLLATKSSTKNEKKPSQISYLRRFVSEYLESQPENIRVEMPNEEIKTPRVSQVSSMEYIRREFKRRRFETMNTYTSKISNQVKHIQSNKFHKSASQIHMKTNSSHQNNLWRQRRSVNLLPVNKKQITLPWKNNNSEAQTIPLKRVSNMDNTFTPKTDPTFFQNRKKLLQTKRSVDKRYFLSGELETTGDQSLTDFKPSTQMISKESEIKQKHDRTFSLNCFESKITKSTNTKLKLKNPCYNLSKNSLARHVIDKVNTKLNNLENVEKSNSLLSETVENRYQEIPIEPSVLTYENEILQKDKTKKYQSVYNNEEHSTQSCSTGSNNRFNDENKSVDEYIKPFFRKKYKPQINNIDLRLLNINNSRQNSFLQATSTSARRCFCSMSESKTQLTEPLRKNSRSTVSTSSNPTYMRYKIKDDNDVIRSYNHDENSPSYSKTIKVIPSSTTDSIKSWKHNKDSSHYLNKKNKYVDVFNNKELDNKKFQFIDNEHKESEDLIPERVFTRYSIERCNALKLLHYTCTKDTKDYNNISEHLKKWFQELCHAGQSVSEKELNILHSICIERFGYPQHTKGLPNRYYKAITAQNDKNLDPDIITT